DTTAFHARVLDADLPRALDVLTDLIRNPVLRTSDLELERKVVLEEINTVADTPDDQVFDLSYETLWPDHPYGYSILGTRDTVSALSAGDLKQLHGRAYFPANCVIAAAGNLTHETLLEELAQLGWFDRATSNGERVTPSVAPVAPAVHGSEARHPKDTAQTHIVFGTDTVPYADPRKYALLVLANVFGGGMSSRLFQRIREELGLAYAIYAFTSFYHQMGVAGVYVGTQPQTAAQAVAAIREEYAKLAREGLRGDALAEAKQQTQGQLMLSLESPSARMYRLAGFSVYGEPYQSLDQVLATVAGVPAGVESLVGDGHTVLVDQGAGLGSGFSDDAYRAAGATLVPRAGDAWSKAEMVVKVKEPIEPEWPCMRKGQVVFTYFHFAASEPLTRAVIKSGIVAIAYETVQLASGELPLLTPMSEVAGRMAVQEGAKYLEKVYGGSGILLGGVPGVLPAEVLIIGGGVVGANAAKMAAGLGARVTLLDLSLDRLRYLADVLPSNVDLLYSNRHNLLEQLSRADLVIGAVLLPGAKAPKLVRRDDLKLMKPGSVIVDVAVDQGGCIETIKPTTHENPV